MDRGKERRFITAAEIVPLDEARVLTERERERRELYELGMKVFFGDIERPQYRPAPSTMEVIDEFLAHKRAANLSEDSISSYGHALRVFGRRYPRLPTEPEQIEKYLEPHRGENSTAWNIYMVINMLYKFVVDRYPGIPNPMEKVQKPRKKAQAPEHLSVSQASRLLGAVQDDRERGLVDCLFGLGLRLKETRLLRVADIGDDTIRVRHGKGRDKELMPLIREIRDDLLKLAQGKGPNDFIFQGKNAQPLSDSQIQNIIKKLFDRAGIRGVRSSPHTLRHSRGVITDIAGLDDYSSKRLMRHASMEMTDRYSQLNLEELKVKEERYNPLRVLARLSSGLGIKPDYAQSQPDVGVVPPPKEPYTEAQYYTSHDSQVETGDSQ